MAIGEENTSGTTTYNAFNAKNAWGQTFRASTNFVMSGLYLMIRKYYETDPTRLAQRLWIYIYNTSGGIPNGDPISVGSILHDDLYNEYTDYTLISVTPVNLLSGYTYAFVGALLPYISGVDNIDTMGATTDVYANGQILQGGNYVTLSHSWATPGFDLRFRVYGELTNAVVVPEVSTQLCTSITAAGAIAHGTIEDTGGVTALTAWGHIYSTDFLATLELGETGVSTVSGSGTGTEGSSYTSTITGLTAGTKYYIRAYGTNSAGTGYGVGLSFIADTSPVIPTQMEAGTISIKGGRLHYYDYYGRERYTQGALAE